MKGMIVKDYNKIDFSNKDHVRKFFGAMNYFMNVPTRCHEVKSAMQNFTTQGDFPAEILNVIEKYHLEASYDTTYEQIFDIKDFTGTNKPGFEILDVSSGLVFSKVKTGEKAKVYKMSGSKVQVTFDRYGGALGWDKTWFEDTEYWNIEDTAKEFRNKAFSSRAQIYYDLIDAVPSSQDITWQLPTPASLDNTSRDYDAVRDINTINKACETTLLALKDAGMDVNANSQFILLAPIQLRSRISRTLSLVNQAFAGSPKSLVYNVQPAFSMMLEDPDKYYIILPKRKMKGGYRQELTMLSNTDILAYAETVAGWMRYGGGIGDIEQIRRCETA